MKPDFNEDEILVLLNDITITDDELSTLEFNDLEKRKLSNKVLTKVKVKSSKRKGFSIAASLILICSIGLANKPVIATINSKIFGDNKAIEQAVENNYVQGVHDGAIKYNGVEVKVSNMVIDKAKLALSFDLKFDNPEILNDLQSLKMDLEIKNELGKILKGYSNQDLSDENMLGVSSFVLDNFEILNKDTGEARYNLILDSLDSNIPVLNRLAINIKNISYYKNINPNDIPGNWQFSMFVNNEFKSNKSILFTGDNTNKEVTINTVEATQTGTVVKFTCPKNVDIDVFNNVYLIDDKGISKNVTGGVTNQDDENNYIYTVTFPISTFDNPNQLKFVIKDFNGKDIEIKLNKK
ncbi:MAG: DUF4179 domain-containing protein [Clostridiaceae bacterium]